MRNLNADVVRDFLVRLGQRYSRPAHLYLIGGAALCLLGSPRSTLDLDYVGNDIKKNELEIMINTALRRGQEFDIMLTEVHQNLQALYRRLES